MKRRVIAFVVVVVLTVAAFAVWRIFFTTHAPASVVFVSGRIEGDDSAIAAKTAGRILEIRYREGDSVHAGDIIARLDDAQVRDAEQAARAALLDAQDRVASTSEQIAVLQEQIAQSALQAVQARSDAAGRVAQARANLATNQTSVAQQRASLAADTFNRTAESRLADQGYVSEQQRVLAITTQQSQAALVVATQRQVAAARGALTTADATLVSAGIFGEARAAIEQQIVQQHAVVASAQAEVSQARAQLAEAQANRRDLTVRAPFSGTIMTRAAEPGEVVTAGTAIVTLLDPNKVYLRGFVPEEQIGNIRIGQAARVYLDSSPNTPVDAYVLRIDPEATFTPENTYFQSDRVKQVFGLKLALRAGFGFAKAGMPADGEILFRGNTWPSAGRSE